MTDDMNYLLDEIAEEGSLHICFEFLRRNHEWSKEKFFEILTDLYKKKIFKLYRYDNIDNFEDVKFDVNKLYDDEIMKYTYFDPNFDNIISYR